jgi:hypothetical protein
MKSNHHLKKKRLALCVAAATLTSAMSAQALNFEFDDSDLRIDWDTNVTYGAMWRVQSAAEKQANLNDGTNNFDTGIVSNKISVVSEADFQWGDYGFFVRGKALYDYRYENQDTDQTAETYLTDNSGDGGGNWTTDIFGFPVGGAVGTTAMEDFHEDTLDIHGKDAFFLDAFLYGDFFVGDRLVSARLGRQVISWGEAQFFPGISGTQSHVDAAAASAPGTEIKEIFLPVGQLYVNFELNAKISMETYYQYEWIKTKQAGVGSYWSNADVTGAGAERLLIIQEGTAIGDLAVPFDVIREDEPDGSSEEAQWGIALRYFMDSGMELGFYRTRYHDKFLSARGLAEEAPLFPQLAAFPSQFQDYYHQDIDVYGASFSTMLGVLQVGGELSYSPNAMPTQNAQPALTGSGAYATPGFVEGHVTQANLTFTYLRGNNPIADDWLLVGEVVGAHHNLSSSDVPDGLSVINSRNAWAYTLVSTLSYKSVISGLNIDVPVAFKHHAEGTWKTLTIADGAKEASIGLKFKYLEDWKGEIKYATFWGSKSTFAKHDRDNISMSVTYSF